MKTSVKTPTKRNYVPNVHVMEERALLSGIGGGHIDTSIARLASTSASLNFTSNTFHQINNNIPNIAKQIAAHPTNTAGIDAALATLVPRLPDGKANFLPTLKADVSTFLSVSPIPISQATTAVTNVYILLLGRRPIASEAAGWIHALQSGTSLTDVTTGIAQSPEFLNKTFVATATAHENNTQLVISLYFDSLGRPPETSGQNFWVNKLDTGVLTPSQVASDFIHSTEQGTRPQSVLAVAERLIGSNSNYEFGTVAPGQPITGNFAGTSQTAQIANLLQQDILTYLSSGISTSFNVLKSHVNFTSDDLLTYNGRV